MSLEGEKSSFSFSVVEGFGVFSMGVSSSFSSSGGLRSELALVKAKGLCTLDTITWTTSSAPSPACSIAKAVTRATSPRRSLAFVTGSLARRWVSFAF